MKPFRSASLIVLVLISISALAQVSHTARQTRPIQLGTSGGDINDITKRYCCSGTLGALVTKNGSQYILSNAHVLAISGTGIPGDDISQPGLIDAGCRVTSNDVVADLSEYAPLTGSNGSNVDAAIAVARSGAVGSDILEIGAINGTPATPTISRGVAKSGRTTGLTCGTIASINTNVSVQYQQSCNAGKKFTVTYSNQVVINSSTFSAGGDSGSLIVTSDSKQPIALLFAGSSTTTIGNPIGDVISALGVSFVGNGGGSVSCPAAAAAATGPARGPSQQALDHATNAKNFHAARLMTDPAIQGVGVGLDPDNPDEAAVIIYVEQGRAHGFIPAELNGVKTVVVRTDRFRATGWNEPEIGGSCSAK